jgi:hypothetical protein
MNNNNNKNKSFSFPVFGVILLLSMQCSAFAATIVGTLIQTIDTSILNPPSPDPSGLAFLGSSILNCDGEVNEIPALFTGANLFELDLTGVLISTGTSTNYSQEPVGCALNTDNGNLFVADDNEKKIYEIHPGADGMLFTMDDINVNIIDTLSFGNGDPEGVAYGNGALFSVDGVSNEVYKLLPGSDGLFGTADDVVTHFDTLSMGIRDPEGIAYDPDHPGHLYITGSEKRSTLFGHVTTAGTLVRTIDYAPAATLFPAGVGAVSQAITGDNTTHVYIADRGIDNNDDPNENDGKIFVVSVPLFNGNQAPSVMAGSDQIIDISLNAILDGTVVDDGNPSPPGALTTTWTKISGPGTVSFADASSVDTTVTFSATGDYQLRLMADDSELSGSDIVQITVTPIPPPFTYTYISTLSGGSAGGVSFADEDIIVYNDTTGTWSMYFDGSDVGLDTTGIDAFQLMADNNFLLSFTTDGVQVTDAMSNTLTIDNSDIVRFIPTALGDNTVGTFEWFFDGSDVGLDTSSENVDAIGFTTNGNLVVSSSGIFNVSGASGDGEDLLAFTATSLGQNTSGTWQLYFDGSDVELGDVASENVNGAWINDVNGDIHLSTTGAFSVTGVSGGGDDIFKCIPGSTGDVTVCNSYGLTWDGLALGLPSGVVVDAIGLDDGSGNTSPIVTISAPTDGLGLEEGMLLTFTGSATDAEDDNATLTSALTWDSSIDGTIGSGNNFGTSTLSVGVHTITASVADSGGLIGLDSITVTINPAGGGNTFPSVMVSSPSNGMAFDEGVSVTFTGSVNDAEDDDATLTAALSWTSSLDGTIGNGGSFGISALSVGTHTITTSVTDSGGLTGMDSINVTINQVGGGNTAPAVTISSPLDGTAFDKGVAVSFTGSATDVEDDDPTLTVAMSWTSSIDGNIGSGGIFGSSALSVGTHTITASVNDSGSLTGTQSISITINRGTSIDIPVRNSFDDAEENVSTGMMNNLKRNVLQITGFGISNQIVGMRYTQVHIPQGATILDAYLQFTSAATSSVTLDLQVWGQDDDNPAIFTSTAGDISSRPKTSSSVSWAPVPWLAIGDAGPDQRTPNIAVVIQEIVNRPNWVNGSSLVVMITGDGSGSRVAGAHTDSNPGVAPLLHVEFITGPPVAVPDVVGLDQTAAESAILADGFTVGTVTFQSSAVVSVLPWAQ